LPHAGGSIISGAAKTTARTETSGEKVAPHAFALAAAELAANTRCEDVVLLDLRGTSPVAQYFLIATGTSPRQMRTVIDEIADLGKRMGFAPWKTSGYESARWIVLDCVSLVAHVFDSDSRDFYDLELLWGDSPAVDWRKELGLPPTAGREAAEKQGHQLEDDLMSAEEEDARLDGRDIDEEEGDADVDEDADNDAPVVVELPDESTGSNSVEFVEVDPPTKRRQRGRAVFPTPLEEQEDTTAEERSVGAARDLGGAAESLDEDDQQRKAEAEADEDVEGVSKEDLPRSRMKNRPMGGVSAGLSSTSIEDPGEEDQEGEPDDEDREQDHQDEVPEAHEEAAETVRIGDVELDTEEPGQHSRKKVLRTRADERGPKKSAPGAVNLKKAKAGVVKAPVKKKAVAKKAIKNLSTKKPATKKPAPKKAAPKKPAAKKPGKKSAAKIAPKKSKPNSKKK